MYIQITVTSNNKVQKIQKQAKVYGMGEVVVTTAKSMFGTTLYEVEVHDNSFNRLEAFGQNILINGWSSSVSDVIA